MARKYLIIYHKEDNDGLVSGTLFYDFLMSNNVKKSEIETMGADYNNLSDFIKNNPIKKLNEMYENIIMTDISFNDPKYMEKLYRAYGDKFIWCDHHKPIIDESRKHTFWKAQGIRNTTKSAILCAYEYLYDTFNIDYDKKDVPEIFRILSAWDSWSYEREGYEFNFVKAVNKAFTITYNLDFESVLNVVHSTINHWNKHHSNFLNKNDLYVYGETLNKYDDVVMEGIIQQSGDKTWQVSVYDEDKGRPLFINACAIFHQGATNSTMFKSLKKTNRDIEIGLVFKHAPNGNWVLSMYNVNDDYWFHCGDFLKEKYGGGGHKGAAGCTLTQEQFIKILKEKKI